MSLSSVLGTLKIALTLREVLLLDADGDHFDSTLLSLPVLFFRPFFWFQEESGTDRYAQGYVAK